MHGWEIKKTQKLLGKSEGKRPHGMPKIRWKDDIIWNLKKAVMRVIEKHLLRIGKTCRAYVLVAMNLRIP